ncbi:MULTISPECIES: conjugal transfer protein TraT [unclassified Pseudomonas]|uniref:conjugal transfer protein TraT n=1 Tax=unclassified Pseudomonas TaxID=196821 RepID=UPI001FFE73B9|nr:conjugal transfer protein TraT [Pseudomonas sp. MWU12-2020]
MDLIEPQAEVEPLLSARREQTPLVPLMLDVSGDPQTPKPEVVQGEVCNCCGFNTTKLWQGARAAHPDSHSACTLCYLTGHLDSPTAAHGRLAYLPGLVMSDVQHLQRRALLAIIGGSRSQKSAGKGLWRWLLLHAREVETAFGSARAGEFAAAMKRLPPHKRHELHRRLTGCALILPADVFEDDLSLLLPTGKTVESALTSRSWTTYTRSDLYVERVPLG